MGKKIIAVVGATGMQGKGVVNALVNEGTFKVRAITRQPDKYQGRADEVVQGDLTDLGTLTNAFRGAYGVFVVTNFWDGADEWVQGNNAVQAAKHAGVQHFVWSTLPNVEEISNGQFTVPQFTGKAKVDEVVRRAGFANYTFVQPPCYYQNFMGELGPQQLQDGTVGWTLPIDPTKKVIHMGDINDLGKVVAGAFLHPEKVGKGSYLSLAAELSSFNDIVAAFKANDKEYVFNQVPAEVFAGFFEGAGGVAQLLGYFDGYTYMGPGADERVKMAKEVATGEFISLREWIGVNVK